MDRFHRDEQTARHLLAHDPRDLVLFVFLHQQPVLVRVVESDLSRHTRISAGHRGRYGRTKTDVSVHLTV